ncbi:YqiA/YcfP family alpha/beta fold hydrolase [Polaromonas jejuensis]|uniref:YqiA/YcfP family alpha/beta fold hydrolase n=1 Tax=Polaromonas jejuensis TaxID=457502 RepID=A0ABW0Q6Y1_9BURK|nr:YqiA/YcfP family alpha/beta fold hydrolase [Polaromonas jejuensis]
MRTTHLLYLHGFRSSPLSAKAQKMAALVQQRHPAVRWWCPPLPPSPRLAMRQIMDGVAHWPREAGFESLAVMGSSLGGFYATAVAERLGCKAVLLNPAVDPARDLSRHIGEQTAWHNPDEHFFFEPRFVDELRALQAGPLKAPHNYLAVIAKGDEVLDWREMTARYAGAQLRLLEGGDHALSDFELHVPAILDFLALA